ncbi:MAG: hypothetical protein ACPG77_11615 [Nannocystaceae bacterium]
MPKQQRPSKIARTLSRCLGLALAVGLAGGCNAVLTTAVFTSPEPLVHGISIPVPPPSLKLAPNQTVDVDGGLDQPEAGATVYLYDHVSEQGYFVETAGSGSFVIEMVSLDLSQNCLELYAQSSDSDAEPSEGVFYRAQIAPDDQSIEVEMLTEPCL